MYIMYIMYIMYVIHALQHVTFDKAAEQTGVKVDASGRVPKTQFRNHEVVHTWSNVEHRSGQPNLQS
jgi:hypothetical protein